MTLSSWRPRSPPSRSRSSATAPLKLSIRTYVHDVEERLPVIHALHTAIAHRFRQERIEIAFPQMDVHVRSSAPEQIRDPARPLRFPGASTQ